MRRIFTYVEEADDAANKVSQIPDAHPAGEGIINQIFILPVITTCRVVTYKRIGIIKYYTTFPIRARSSGRRK